MCGKRGPFVGAALCLAAVICLQRTALADVTIGVSGVPEKLSFPLPEGTNVILTADVKGGHVRAAWLSHARDSQARFMLVPVGDGAYQVNLADRVLSAMIRASRNQSQFQIFAETDDGRVVASVPVLYVIEEARRLPARIFIYEDGQKKEIWSPRFDRMLEDMAMLAHLSDSSLWVFPATLPPGKFGTERAADPYYFAPREVERIEARFEEAALGPYAEARVGDETWTFGIPKAANVLDLPVSAEIRKAWEKHGGLEIVCGQQGGEERRLVLKAPPKGLSLVGDSITMTVVQRHSKEVPGSEGYLKMRIGDITGGQVLLSVTAADGQTLIAQKSVRAGDEETFVVGEEQYKLRAESLVNFIVGDDYGVFTVSRVLPVEVDEIGEREKIGRLIAIIEESDITFIRNNRECTPKQAAEHIRKKYGFAQEDIQTLDEFIDKVASYSWTSGRDYLVRSPDGTEVKAKAWLREQSERLSESEVDK